MTTFREVVAWVVFLIGIGGWVVYIPQITLLIRKKESGAISFGLLWGSVAMKLTILLHLLIQIKVDWRLALVYSTSIVCLAILLQLTYRYRRWPGGRKKTP